MIPWPSIPDATRCARCGLAKIDHHPAGYCASQTRTKEGGGAVLIVPGTRPDRFVLEGGSVRFAPRSPKIVDVAEENVA